MSDLAGGALLILNASGKMDLALIPEKLFMDEKIEELNGKSANGSTETEEERDQIVDLFDRLGLIEPWEPSKEDLKHSGKIVQPKLEQDLKQYLNPEPPFVVIKICWIVF
jgi:hypothetical protein